MKKIIFLFFLLGLGLYISCTKKEVQQPNILWILAEDLSPDLGCYGNSVVETPVLDKMALQGMRFTNVFTTAPFCTPSRTALATGMYQTSINAHHMRFPEELKNPLPAGILPLNELLRRNGYQTANIKDVPGTGKTDWSFRSDLAYYDVSSWDQIDPDDPFFAVVCLRLTHRPFERDSLRPVDPDAVQLPPYYPDHIVARRDWAGYFESIQLMDRQVGMVLDEVRKRGWSDNTIVFFFGDHGRPFTRAKTFLYDSGIKIPLIITSPENLDWSAYLPKGSENEALISAIDISATTLSMAGIDKPKTMQGKVMLGADREKDRDYIYAASDRHGEVFFKSRAVRSKKFKYIRNFNHDFSINEASTAYKKSNHPIYHLIDILADRDQLNQVQKNLVMPLPDEELYDVENDPYEVVNLADEPAFVDQLEEMRNALSTWQDQTTDYGMLEDSPAIVQHFIDYGVQSAASRVQKTESLRQYVLHEIDRTNK
jgi:N-sulfoglucosamine sulfohydrolase